VRSKFGVDPEFIPDYLALVGDAADGYPGMKGIGAKGAASLVTRYGKIENFPAEVLGERRALALLFKKLATLRTDVQLFTSVEELQWSGPAADFGAVCGRLGISEVCTRALKTRELITEPS
jgi:5'-3' exonuclease